MPYIHDRPDWPAFRWDAVALAAPLADARYRQGRLFGRMEALGFDLGSHAELATLTADVVTSSAIEGERLDEKEVRSSIARRLGVDFAGLAPAGRDVEGIVEMMLDATRRFDEPLSSERLFAWHASLFPTGRNGIARIRVGDWRDDAKGPMQVVSGPIGRERVHFQAPAAERLPAEMGAFLSWFASEDGVDPVLRAGIAHLWFVTIHPFDDGNGRVARAVADMALARAEDSPRRFYSMSAQIRAERSRYYAMLEETQRGGLDVTRWLDWFVGCLDRSLHRAETTLAGVIAKARFWERYRETPLEPRQRAMVNRLLDGFEGRLTSSRYAAMAKCSQDTALRDIQALVAHGMLARGGEGGRSTNYRLVR